MVSAMFRKRWLLLLLLLLAAAGYLILVGLPGKAGPSTQPKASSRPRRKTHSGRREIVMIFSLVLPDKKYIGVSDPGLLEEHALACLKDASPDFAKNGYRSAILLRKAPNRPGIWVYLVNQQRTEEWVIEMDTFGEVWTWRTAKADDQVRNLQTAAKPPTVHVSRRDGSTFLLSDLDRVAQEYLNQHGYKGDFPKRDVIYRVHFEPNNRLMVGYLEDDGDHTTGVYFTSDGEPLVAGRYEEPN